MKKILVTIIVAAMTAAFSCNPISQDTASGHAPKRDLSVGIIIDGTDLKSQQSSIPVVTTKFLREFTDVFQQKASGSVFVTYIDDDFRNNGEPVFANFNYSIPEPVSKRGDETGEEFKSRLTRYREDSAAVAQKMATDFQSFVNEVKVVQVVVALKTPPLCHTLAHPHPIFAAESANSRIQFRLPENCFFATKL